MIIYNKKGKMLSYFLIVLLLLAIRTISYCQTIENEFELQNSIEISKKLIKNLNLSITPEVRFNENFELQEFHFNEEISYKPFNLLTIQAAYRLVGDINKNDEIVFLHRFNFNSTLAKTLNSFKLGARISYTNYTDDDDSNQFFKYKLLLSYNISDCKFTPKTGFEIFHLISNNILYKYRFNIGGEYKLSKSLALNAQYKFDFYKTKYKNKHIAEIGLKLKF